jgi:hypothetical protein
VTACACESTRLDVTLMLWPPFSWANYAAEIVTWCGCEAVPCMEYVLVAPAATSTFETASEWPWFALMLVAVVDDARGLVPRCGMLVGFNAPGRPDQIPVSAS